MTLDVVRLREIEGMLSDDVLTVDELVDRLRGAGLPEVARALREAAEKSDRGLARIIREMPEKIEIARKAWEHGRRLHNTGPVSGRPVPPDRKPPRAGA